MGKRGNPAWYRGMPSANPRGRPRGQNSYEAFCQDPDKFFNKHRKWELFAHVHILTAANGAAAARYAGYSRKSARFIASRLMRKPMIRAKRNRINWHTCNPLDKPRYERWYPDVKWKD